MTLGSGLTERSARERTIHDQAVFWRAKVVVAVAWCVMARVLCDFYVPISPFKACENKFGRCTSERGTYMYMYMYVCMANVTAQFGYPYPRCLNHVCYFYMDFRVVIESSESESDGRSPDVKKRLFSGTWLHVYTQGCSFTKYSPCIYLQLMMKREMSLTVTLGVYVDTVVFSIV